MMRYLLLVLLLAGCSYETPPDAIAGNGKVDVTVLVRFEDVTVYEVHRPFRSSIYVAVTSGNARTTWSERSGKTTVEHSVETVRR
jgi:hypothetical protein